MLQNRNHQNTWDDACPSISLLQKRTSNFFFFLTNSHNLILIPQKFLFLEKKKSMFKILKKYILLKPNISKEKKNQSKILKKSTQ